MENLIPNEGISKKERNKIALRFGLFLGLFYVPLALVANTFVASYFIHYAARFLVYVFYMILVGVFAARIRKANGGYIEFSELFGATFVMLLVGGIIAFVYNYVYIAYIDPDFSMKMKEATLSMMERQNLPEEQLDKVSTTFDEQIAKSKKFNFGDNIFALLGSIILDTLIGLIPVAILKKPRPLF